MLSFQQNCILRLLRDRGPLCVAVIRHEVGLSSISAAKTINRLAARGAVRISADKAVENAVVELVEVTETRRARLRSAELKASPRRAAGQ